MTTSENTVTGFDLKSEDIYVFPATYPQQQIWFLFQLDPESGAYNIPFAYDIDGPFNVDALKNSVNEIIRRHEIFRTTYTEMDEGPVQVVFPALTINIPVTDDLKDQNSIDQYIKAFSKLPFNLELDPLIRCEVIKISDTKHTLLLNFHHIMLDHLSIVQFAEELDIIYRAYNKGKPSPLVEPDMHYADYAVWQKEFQNHDYFSEKLDFWKDLLKGKSDYLDLPKDHARQLDDPMHGAEHHLHFPAKLNEKLKQLSREQSVSMFITMLAGFSITCQRYARQDEVAIGTPFANRSHQPELEKVMGCFINTLPLMADLSGNPSFNEVLKRLRKVVFGASGQQDMPFERIIDVLQPKRDPSYNPVFQVGFTFQEAPMEIDFPDCTVKSQCLHNETTKFDILAWLWDAEDGIHGLLEYNTALFETETLESFCNHYEQLLESASKQPDLPISQLCMTSTQEQKHITQQFNQTELNINETDRIQNLFEKQVTENKNKIAVICDDRQYTYNELNIKANQLAHYLIQQGVKPGSLVGLCLDRSVDVLAMLLGILKAGAGYVPLDPEYPEDRLAYMVEDAEMKFLITETKHKEQFSTVEKLLELETFNEQLTHQPDTIPDVNIPADSTAYVIYTSGSTGKPKGVVVPHNAVVNLLYGIAKKPGLNRDDKLLGVSTLSFDIATIDLYLPLTVGAQLVLATKDDAIDGERLLELMTEHDITFMQATPITWRILISEGWSAGENFKAISTGEAMPKDLARDLFTRTSELWNMYGPTETTVWSTGYQITDAEAPVLIGEPVANTQCYILDTEMQIVPIGVSGELYIGGTGVTKGYLNREELTDERFITNPFQPNSKLYRTGDLVKYTRDGNIDYQQRIDNQVKVRGFRIELGEIESVLSKLDSIKQAVVTVKEQRPGDPRLVAYVILNENTSVTTTSIRQEVRKDLPDYMLPQSIVELEEMPLTPNGKINHRELPSPFTNNAQDDDITAPRNSAEQQLVAIWSDALDMPAENICVFDNFFDIGGHSLLSMSVISKIRDVTGIKLSPRIMLLSSLEHIAPQCGFDEKEIRQSTTADNSENKTTRKPTSGVKGLLKKLFK
jgi:amino acid adenylation domain-containing protein